MIVMDFWLYTVMEASVIKKPIIAVFTAAAKSN